ncbi:hypothetical protein BHE74_00050386 [Ensete ventricosum]|nr:hypothetical protein BHE74_00050386 [Ensete ventricosum]
MGPIVGGQMWEIAGAKSMAEEVVVVGLSSQLRKRETVIGKEQRGTEMAVRDCCAEGENGGGGSGKSGDGGFWGRTVRNSFIVVLMLPTKVVNGCGMPAQPKAMTAMIVSHEDGCKIFGAEVAAEIGCESQWNTKDRCSDTN